MRIIDCNVPGGRGAPRPELRAFAYQHGRRTLVVRLGPFGLTTVEITRPGRKANAYHPHLMRLAAVEQIILAAIVNECEIEIALFEHAIWLTVYDL